MFSPLKVKLVFEQIASASDEWWREVCRQPNHTNFVRQLLLVKWFINTRLEDCERENMLPLHQTKSTSLMNFKDEKKTRPNEKRRSSQAMWELEILNWMKWECNGCGRNVTGAGRADRLRRGLASDLCGQKTFNQLKMNKTCASWTHARRIFKTTTHTMIPCLPCRNPNRGDLARTLGWYTFTTHAHTGCYPQTCSTCYEHCSVSLFHKQLNDLEAT